MVFYIIYTHKPYLQVPLIVAFSLLLAPPGFSDLESGCPAFAHEVEELGRLFVLPMELAYAERRVAKEIVETRVRLSVGPLVHKKWQRR